MMGTHKLIAVITGVVLTSCASTRIVLEKPISDGCVSSGLQGCPELTDGILLYVEGDQQSAGAKIKAAVHENEPREVMAFANGLKLLSALPGADSFMGPM